MKKANAAAALAALVLVMAGAPAVAGPAEREIKVKEVAGFLYCSLPCKGPFSALQQNIELLFGSMTAQNIAPVGPMLGVFFNNPATTKEEDLQWEIGFPVTETNALEPLRLRQWTFTLVAETVHVGSYESSGSTYAELMAWVEANGYTVAGPIMEKYLSDPNSTRPQDLKTEIWIPVTKD